MNEVEKPPGVKNATILMVLIGLLLIYTGIQIYYFTITDPYTFHPLFGIFVIFFGIISLCASLPVWLQKSWAKTTVTGIGIAICGTFAIFGYYLVIVFFALWYWAVTDYIRTSRIPQHPDWDDN